MLLLAQTPSNFDYEFASTHFFYMSISSSSPPHPRARANTGPGNRIEHGVSGGMTRVRNNKKRGLILKPRPSIVKLNQQQNTRPPAAASMRTRRAQQAPWRSGHRVSCDRYPSVALGHPSCSTWQTELHVACSLYFHFNPSTCSVGLSQRL